MDLVKINLAAINEKLARNEKRFDESLKSNVEKITSVVETVASEVKLVQEQLNKQKEKDDRFETEMRKSLSEITKQLERMAQHGEVRAEQMRKEIAEAVEVEREPKVVVAGGSQPRNKKLNSVEMFSLSSGAWIPLQPMRNRLVSASSVVCNNHIFVIGGFDGNWIMNVQRLSLNAVEIDQTTTWEDFPVVVPAHTAGNCSVVYNDQLIVIGGYDSSNIQCSNGITQISLVPPYTCKLLATMQQKRWYHGVAIFGDKILILGGKEVSSHIFKSVVMYNITKNECQELAPLPYPVCEMATVKWDDDNVIMGGSDGTSLNKVLMYNIKTQKIQMLPDMKYKRAGCVAAVARNTVIVIGGYDGRNILKSVESFRFDRYSWEELPEMHEARRRATAVAC